MPSATTAYPCCVSALGGFSRSWTHGSLIAKLRKFPQLRKDYMKSILLFKYLPDLRPG